MATCLVWGCHTTEASEPPAFALVQIDAQNVTPIGRNGFRPDVVTIQDTLYLAYNDAAARGFRLIRLREDLTTVEPVVDLYSARAPIDFPTDIRVAAGAPNTFWSAFETVVPDATSTACDERWVNAAIYDAAGAEPSLSASAVDLITGCPPPNAGASRALIYNNPVADDPTPFYHQGSYYVMARSAMGPMLHFHSYDAALQETENFIVDLEPTIGDQNISQNTLISIEGQVYLIAGVASGPPVIPTSTSQLLAIPLAADLRSVAGAVVELLTDPTQYNTRSTSAIYDDGRLYTNGLDSWADAGDGTTTTAGYLHVFDVAGGFSVLERIEIERGSSVDSHSSLAIIGGKVYVFYQGEGQQLLVKVFE